MTAHNDDTASELGIRWETEPVSKRNGPNGSDTVEWRADAQIPHVVDLDAARKGFGDTAVLAGLNGTSWRVAAQDVARRNDRKMPIAQLRAAVVARLKGIRTHTSTTRTVEIVRYPSMTELGELVEMTNDPAANLALLVDNGYAPEVARKLLKL